MSSLTEANQAPELITRTAKMLPYPKRVKAVPSFATAYYFDTETNPEAAGLGNLYVVIEVLSSPKQAEEVSDLLIETVGHNYYNAGSHFHSRPGAIMQRFEAAVKSANHELADYANRGNAAWVGRMSAVIAVISGSELHVTQTGSAEAYLYRSNATSRITAELQPKGPSRPINTFANIASGQLQTGDRVLIGTPALFRQVSKPDLKARVRDNTPNGAVLKLSELVQADEDADRIAGIVLELTTAELLAMQTRPVEPDEVKIGQPSRPLDVAKEVTRPMVDVVVKKTKELGRQGVGYSQTTLMPSLRQLAIKLTQKLRVALSQRRGRQGFIAVFGILLIVAGWLAYNRAQATELSNLAKRYDSAFSQFERGTQAIAAGQKTVGREELIKAQKDLTALSNHPKHKALDLALAKRPHPENDPAKINQLEAQLALALDQIDGLVRVEPTTVIEFKSLKDAKPTLFEIVGSKLILIDSQNGSSIYSYDLTTGKLTTALASPANLGKVVTSTVSSSGDGTYLLTAEPAVWLYRPEDNTLKRQETSFGQWPKGRAISSYSGNLYILSEDGSQVYKHIPTAGGFSAKQSYFSSGAAATIANSTALAVDGSVYVGGGSSSLRRFASGTRLDVSATGIPDSFSQPGSIHSIGANGNIILMFDAKSNHIGIVSATENTLAFQKQYVAKGLDKVYQVQADSKASTIFALTNGKVVKFPL